MQTQATCNSWAQECQKGCRGHAEALQRPPIHAQGLGGFQGDSGLLNNPAMPTQTLNTTAAGDFSTIPKPNWAIQKPGSCSWPGEQGGGDS